MEGEGGISPEEQGVEGGAQARRAHTCCVRSLPRLLAAVGDGAARHIRSGDNGGGKLRVDGRRGTIQHHVATGAPHAGQPPMLLQTIEEGGSDVDMLEKARPVWRPRCPMRCRTR